MRCRALDPEVLEGLAGRGAVGLHPVAALACADEQQQERRGGVGGAHGHNLMPSMGLVERHGSAAQSQTARSLRRRGKEKEEDEKREEEGEEDDVGRPAGAAEGARGGIEAGESGREEGGLWMKGGEGIAVSCGCNESPTSARRTSGYMWKRCLNFWSLIEALVKRAPQRPPRTPMSAIGTICSSSSSAYGGKIMEGRKGGSSAVAGCTREQSLSSDPSLTKLTLKEHNHHIIAMTIVTMTIVTIIIITIIITTTITIIVIAIIIVTNIIIISSIILILILIVTMITTSSTITIVLLCLVSPRTSLPEGKGSSSSSSSTWLHGVSRSVPTWKRPMCSKSPQTWRHLSQTVCMSCSVQTEVAQVRRARHVSSARHRVVATSRPKKTPASLIGEEKGREGRERGGTGIRNVLHARSKEAQIRRGGGGRGDGWWVAVAGEEEKGAREEEEDYGARERERGEGCRIGGGGRMVAVVVGWVNWESSTRQRRRRKGKRRMVGREWERGRGRKSQGEKRRMRRGRGGEGGEGGEGERGGRARGKRRRMMGSTTQRGEEREEEKADGEYEADRDKEGKEEKDKGERGKEVEREREA